MEASLENLEQIFYQNKEKRICVLGTTCTGKSTLLDALPMGVDMDEEIFPLLSTEETDYVCSSPWTEEIGDRMNELVRERVVIKPGNPLFGTVLLPCDLIVYLHIEDDLLLERTRKRGATFLNAKNMQKKIEEEIKKAGIDTIVLEVKEKKKGFVR